jgi:hypothetical protein
LLYSTVLKKELLGANIEDFKGQCDDRGVMVPSEERGFFRENSSFSVDIRQLQEQQE